MAIVAITLAGLVGLLWGVSRLGEEARREIWSRDRYRTRFDAIQCDPPPGRDRAAFLAEVRYLSGAPETVQSLAPDLVPTLASAFAKHPWVASCEQVSIAATGDIRVQLRFRRPSLAVRTSEGIRVIADDGVLLPLDADPAGFPELTTNVLPPNVLAGQVWANESVQKALKLVDAHHPRTVEKTPTGWRLTMPGGQVLKIEN